MTTPPYPDPEFRAAPTDRLERRDICETCQRLRSGLIEVIRLSPDSPGAAYAKRVLAEAYALRDRLAQR